MKEIKKLKEIIVVVVESGRVINVFEIASTMTTPKSVSVSFKMLPLWR